MSKKKYYMVVDTETATLPFAKKMCDSANEMKRIAITMPLVYDIGWVVFDRKGEVVKEENFLIQETFFVPDVFSTAYYKEKRPIYMELLKKGEIKRATWDEAMTIFERDLQMVDISLAYNATFDFKKAIPFTEQYIANLYGDYNEWERRQYGRAKGILERGNTGKNEEFLNPFFEFRGNEYPIADLWAMACDKLINIDKYRNYCLENGYLTDSVQYFKTNAEVAFQYLLKQYNFIEDHTALSDSHIERQIAMKYLKRAGIKPYLEAFPFRNLGTTIAYVEEKKPKYKPLLVSHFEEYIIDNDGENKAAANNRYWKRIMGYYTRLAEDI